MTREEAANMLYKNGWERSTTKWYVYRKMVANIAWFASIGSVPHLPKDRPFAVYIHASGQFGENYLTTATLENKLKYIDNQTIEQQTKKK